MLMSVSEGIADLGKKAEKVSKKLTKTLTVPLTAIAAASVKLADRQVQAEEMLLTALRGREDVQQRLIRQAGELQARSKLGDEVIIEQQTYLAALGMTEQQIGDTMNAAVQLSAALRISLESAVKNLAKTFGGMTGELGESIPALKSLTKEQLMAGEAISFVNENYKGFAETATQNLGVAEQAKNVWGDVAEMYGKIILPYVVELAKKLKELGEWLQDLPPKVHEVTVEVGLLAAALGPLLLGFGKVVGFLGKIKGALPAIVSGLQVASPLLIGLGSKLTPDEWMGEEQAAKMREFAEHIAAGGSATAWAAEQIRNKYIPAVEEAAMANERLAESIKKVDTAPTPTPTPKITPVSGIATNDANLAGLGGGVQIDNDMLTEQIANTSTFAQGLAQMRAEMQGVEANATALAEQTTLVGDIVAGAFSGMVDAMAEGFRALGAGEELKNPWASLLKMLGSALETLGKELIIYSGIIEKIKAAFTSLMSKPFGWGIALAAGTAAVAIGAAMRGRAEAMLKVPALAEGGLAYSPTLAVVGDNRGASRDPEVIAPLSKLRQYMGAPSLELAGDVELRVSGDSLVAVLNRTNSRIKYRG